MVSTRNVVLTRRVVPAARAAMARPWPSAALTPSRNYNPAVPSPASRMPEAST